MPFDLGEGEDRSQSGLDPRWLLIGTIVYVIAVVATPLTWRMMLGAEALLLAFLVGISGAPPRALIARWLGFLVLFGFLAVLVAPTRTERFEIGVAGVAASLLFKDSLAFVATLLLVRVVPFRKLLVAMRRLGVPSTLVSTLHFMYRYVFVLGDELERMLQARRARTFRPSHRLEWILLSGMLGRLFLRSFERGERVHDAMLARGWDGTMRSLD